MTVSVLCAGVTAVQLAPSNGILPVGSQSVNPAPPGASPLNTQTQTFQLLVTCTGGGNCAATAIVMVSNDNINWTSYGLTLAAASGVSPNTAIANGLQPWQYFTAYISVISGTKAVAQVLMGS